MRIDFEDSFCPHLFIIYLRFIKNSSNKPYNKELNHHKANSFILGTKVAFYAKTKYMFTIMDEAEIIYFKGLQSKIIMNSFTMK